MRNIGFVINAFSGGGAERVLARILAYLQSDNDKRVFLIFLEKHVDYAIPDNVKVYYLSNFTKKTNALFKFAALPILAIRLIRIIRREKIHVVQSHLYRANYVNVLARMLEHRFECQIVNTDAVSTRFKGRGVVDCVNIFLIKWLYPKADLIISKARLMKLDLERYIGNHKRHIIINNPFDCDCIIRDSQSECGFPFLEKKRYIISVGRLTHTKRQRDIISLLSRLPEDIDLILLGEGEDEVPLKAFANNLGIEHRVHFPGRVMNPHAFIKRSDLFVLASENEGFPNVIVESMLCNCPVVSSDCISGPREIISPNSDVDKQLENSYEITETGALYPVGDVEIMTRVVLKVINSSELRSSIALSAFVFAKKYDIKVIGSVYKAVIEGKEGNCD